MIWLLGVLGNGGFAVVCLPDAWKALKTGRTDVPLGIASRIWASCICLYLYVLLKNGFDPLMLTGGVLEIGAYSIVIWHHFFPRG